MWTVRRAIDSASHNCSGLTLVHLLNKHVLLKSLLLQLWSQDKTTLECLQHPVLPWDCSLITLPINRTLLNLKTHLTHFFISQIWRAWLNSAKKRFVTLFCKEILFGSPLWKTPLFLWKSWGKLVNNPEAFLTTWQEMGTPVENLHFP